jgi:Ni/Co efflux regulator RcnB
MAGPRPGGPPGRQFGYHGHMFNRVHLAPFVYPRGWAYRRWAIGLALPPVFLAPDYYYADWATLGLEPPQPGFQWVRYGPDLLLVDVNTGQVVDAAYGVFDEG